jgi:hypothetical protein
MKPIEPEENELASTRRALKREIINLTGSSIS